MDGQIIDCGSADVAGFGAPVPDPALPFFLPLPRGQTVGKRWIAQMQMRSRIFAAARMCMAELGFDGVHLKPIAEECGISVQTIYNIAGDRGQVLRDSSEDWVLMLTAAARAATGQDGNASLLFSMIEIFWSSPLRWPSYVTRAVEISAARREPLNEPFIGCTTKVLRGEIFRLRQLGLLGDSVDPTSLARQLTSATHALICGWAFDRYDVGQYQRELVNGPCLMLLGAVRGDERGRVEDSIRRLVR